MRGIAEKTFPPVHMFLQLVCRAVDGFSEASQLIAAPDLGFCREPPGGDLRRCPLHPLDSARHAAHQRQPADERGGDSDAEETSPWSGGEKERLYYRSACGNQHCAQLGKWIVRISNRRTPTQ